MVEAIILLKKIQEKTELYFSIFDVIIETIAPEDNATKGNK